MKARCGPSLATSGGRSTPVMILNQENIMTKLDQHNRVENPRDWDMPTRRELLDEINRLKDDRLVLAVLLAMFAVISLVLVFYAGTR